MQEHPPKTRLPRDKLRNGFTQAKRLRVGNDLGEPRPHDWRNADSLDELLTLTVLSTRLKFLDSLNVALRALFAPLRRPYETGLSHRGRCWEASLCAPLDKVGLAVGTRRGAFREWLVADVVNRWR
jgi:hypothetical protein